MKEMNELERQLRSWAPRRPSAKLEARLFHSPVEVAPPLPVFRLSWLAPVAVTCLLITVLFNPRSSSSLTEAHRPSPMMAMMLSNQSAAASSPASLPNPKGVSLAGAFEWTNLSGSSINTVQYIRLTN